MLALGCRVDIKNHYDMTPLHSKLFFILYFLAHFFSLRLLFVKAATEKNEIDAVRCLCLAGPDLTIVNKNGMTAEDMALSSGYSSIANLLGSLREGQNREIFIEQLVPNDQLLRKIKIKVFGSSGVGKSTLIDSMNCSYLNSFFRKTRLNSNQSKKAKNLKSMRKNLHD
jgi:hypothetical protein